MFMRREYAYGARLCLWNTRWIGMCDLYAMTRIAWSMDSDCPCTGTASLGRLRRGTGTVRPRRELCVVFMVHIIRTDCDRPVL
ncbi:hypothetical protein M6B38_318740 [Iris pallida]|uniref:Uncharacterized protein n=1 Tax=Iris pallida TaxID=29817 RepID=A0AAX6HDK3_IRIPA|nr:hypothetical protein M6B38_318740 [Iris pallida]